MFKGLRLQHAGSNFGAKSQPGRQFGEPIAVEELAGQRANAESF